ncbi:NAD-dependent malic enzyme [Candidatus Falkowbacteria bacterium CG1_02_37_44]|uniref:NAD-dependent malic enzyme n=1 Tax=Candidatus Falkowbacteria bacterium CG1_02_37_44 TaxID=1805146 RepID=A0A1J4T722_9BACT|nr:MAG: NAD-dependent malic enzyme [Candidatus Falkowbacteria bacterium CG1_02_37_44]
MTKTNKGFKADLKKEALEIHERHKGKIEVISKIPVKNKKDLSLVYTPGVAEVCKEIAINSENIYKYTIKSNTIAVVTDGSAVLGLGNIGPEAALPVMEGKCLLFKEFGGVDAFPICLATQKADQIVDIIKKISPAFGGVNLEDISAPRCFEIEERLKKDLKIPVFHDDQHGTAIVVLAAVINALKVVKKDKKVKIVISGAGAAGMAVTKMLFNYGFKNIIVCDRDGAIYEGRRENMNWAKDKISKITNREKIKGSLAKAMAGSDIFIGVSASGLVNQEMVRAMARESVVFAMANPTPEIMPQEALKAGAKIVATGRSDFPNQINNVLAFPGIFKGALKIRAQITENMKLAAAQALAGIIKPTPEKILPDVFDNVAGIIANAIVNKR